MQDFIDANGIRFNVAIDGREGAPWLTFSNSHATDLSLWDEQAGRLQDRFRVLRYDTRGHGKTQATEAPYRFDLLCADVAALWDELRVMRSHWAGLSLGGTTGLEMAARYPERIMSVAACDCRCNAPPQFAAAWDPRIAAAERDGLEALVARTLERWFTEKFRAGNPPVLEKVAKMIRATSVAGYVGCAEALKTIDVETRLADIRCPTLFLTGDKDPSAPPDLMRAWAAAVPDSRFTVIEAAAHISNLEQPARFNAALEGFLDEVGRV
jgi:3-oxoadipate enol-lactonase